MSTIPRVHEDAIIDLSHCITKVGEHCVGGGRFGDVYQGIRVDSATDPGRKTLVAIKVVRPVMGDVLQSKRMTKQLKREMAVWQGLSHDNIVPFLGVSYTFGMMPALISLWMENGQLNVYLTAHPDADRGAIVKGLASGLLYLHTRDPKITHGDIKTANTLVDREGNPRLCDFGLSRMLSDESLWVTTTMNPRGSVRWMAPELLEGTEVLPTSESDVYAFAMTVLEVITGDIPYHRYRMDGAVIMAVTARKELPNRPSAFIGFHSWQVTLDELWLCLRSCWDHDPRWRPEMAGVEEFFRLGRNWTGSTLDRLYAQLEYEQQLQHPTEWNQPFANHDAMTAQRSLQEPNMIQPPSTQVPSAPGSLRSPSQSQQGQGQDSMPTIAPAYPVTAPDDMSLSGLDNSEVNFVWLNPDNEEYADSGECGMVQNSFGKNEGLGELKPGPFEGHTNWINSVTFSANGKRIASGSSDRTVRVWDATTGELVAGPFEGHADDVSSVAFSPDCKRLASGSHDHMVRVWHVEIGEMVSRLFEGHTDWVNSVAFSPTGKWIVSGSNDHRLQLWETDTGASLWSFDGHGSWVKSVAFSPDGKRIVSGSNDTTVRVWDAETGKAATEPFEGHTVQVNSVAFSPDGRWVVSGSYDWTVIVWDAETGEFVFGPFESPSARLTSLSVSSDGRRIASGSNDQMVRVWDAETGHMLFGLSGHTDAVASVAFSPDGQRIVSGSHDRTIRMWHAQAIF